jgi:hypothetical protein
MSATYDKNQMLSLQQAIDAAHKDMDLAKEANNVAQIAAAQANKKSSETASALADAKRRFDTASDALSSYLTALKSSV